MTPLRARMVEDMRLRRFAPSTQYNYLKCVERLAAHYGRSPETLDQEEVRAFLVYMVTETGLTYTLLAHHVSALRFLYRVTLRRPWTTDDLPYPRREKRLPSIPPRELVLRYLKSVPNIKHRAILTTCYATGLRVSEAVRLKVTDIDSVRMLIRVEQGKRCKDRVVPLSKGLLELLRIYWRAIKPDGSWLFPGRYGQHLSVRVVQHASLRARQSAGITQKLTVHTLRHGFATFLLDSGTNLRTIQMLLGHGSIRSTTVYTHVSPQDLVAVPSPIDDITLPS